MIQFICVRKWVDKINEFLKNLLETNIFLLSLVNLELDVVRLDKLEAELLEGYDVVSILVYGQQIYKYVYMRYKKVT